MGGACGCAARRLPIEQTVEQLRGVGIVVAATTVTGGGCVVVVVVEEVGRSALWKNVLG